MAIPHVLRMRNQPQIRTLVIERVTVDMINNLISRCRQQPTMQVCPFAVDAAVYIDAIGTTPDTDVGGIPRMRNNILVIGVIHECHVTLRKRNFAHMSEQ